jgi:tetratricopeptide (TPR) repeat protein
MVLETLREFALERLKESGEEVNVRRAHAEIFAKLAENVEISLLNQENEKWNILVETELDNFRTALRYSIQSKQLVYGMKMIGSLGSWFFRGPIAEGIRWAKEIMETEESKEITLVRAKALRSYGQLYWGLGDIPNALQLFAEAASFVRNFDNKIDVCDVLIWCELSYLGGDINQARELFNEALGLADELDSMWHRGIAYFFLAIVEMAHQNIETAGALFEQGTQFSTNLPWLRGGSFMLYGAYLLAIQQTEKALNLLDESLRLLTQVRDLKNQIAVMSMLAGASLIQNNFQKCRDIHRAAILLCQETGELGGLFSHFCGLSLLFSETNNIDPAIRIMASADAIQKLFGVSPIPGTDIFSQSAPSKIEELKSKLDPAEFEKAWSEGAILSTNEAIEYACGVLDAMELS